jgi:LacI family gluconate utilization system Gnt-I transcriptional repressor
MSIFFRFNSDLPLHPLDPVTLQLDMLQLNQSDKPIGQNLPPVMGEDSCLKSEFQYDIDITFIFCRGSMKTMAPAQTNKPPTMADVARLAGVSPMAVSRALRSDGSISEAKKDKILRAVKELGYVLDQSAGSLSSGRTGFVAALIPSMSNSNFAESARGMTDELAKVGIQLLLGYTDYNFDTEERLIESMLRRRPEGIILTGGKHTPNARQMLEMSGVPVVETWDVPENPIDQVVGFSNRDAMSFMVKTLAAKGYERFAFIGSVDALLGTQGSQRRDGFIDALRDLNLPAGRLVTFDSPPVTVEQGKQAISTILQTWPDTDAVVCVSDLAAFGAIMECSRRGIRVPEDIAIAGFGDYEIAAFCHPSITTMSLGSYAIGQEAAKMILQSIARGRTQRFQEIKLTNYRMITRESA